MDSTGNLYVSDLSAGGSLWRITPAGDSSMVASDLGFATGITVAPDGRTVLVSATFHNSIWAVTPDGEKSTYATIDAPWALVFDPDGNLFVGQRTQVTRMSPGGSREVVATGFGGVRGLAVLVPEPNCMLAGAVLGHLLFLRARRAR